MNNIHSEATLTSKGQITLPKPIRQALGLVPGERVAFDLVGTQVVISRIEAADEHADPAIARFLGLLEQDIATGRHVGALPDGLAAAMRDAAQGAVANDDEILGDVSL